MKRLKQLSIVLFVMFIFFGCASKIPHMLASDYGKRGTRLIAVMPIKNHTSDLNASKVLREMVVNELYFKGYPKIPISVIDEKLSSTYGSKMDFSHGDIPPKVMGDLFSVDAVLYCTLIESKTSFVVMYARTSINVTFELRSVKTGETLWSAKYNMVKRSFGVSRKQLEMEAYQVYEPAIQEAVDKAMYTLPDCSDV
jgi:hypothetical protein